MPDIMQELEDRYAVVFNQVKNDESLMLQTLVTQFGGVEELWKQVHTHVTSLEEMGDLDAADAASEVQDLEQAFNIALSKVIEQEFLTDRIETISKTEEGYKLFLESGAEVEITDIEVKEKIFLQNNELAFNHFAGLMEESDILEVFRIVDLFYAQ